MRLRDRAAALGLALVIMLTAWLVFGVGAPHECLEFVAPVNAKAAMVWPLENVFVAGTHDPRSGATDFPIVHEGFLRKLQEFVALPFSKDFSVVVQLGILGKTPLLCLQQIILRRRKIWPSKLSAFYRQIPVSPCRQPDSLRDARTAIFYVHRRLAIFRKFVEIKCEEHLSSLTVHVSGDGISGRIRRLFDFWQLLIHGAKLKSGNYVIPDIGQSYYQGQYCYDCSGVIRVFDEVPQPHNFLQGIVWVMLGIISIGTVVFGLALLYLSFSDKGSGVMLLKGLVLVAVGWISSVFCFFHAFAD